MAGSGFLSGREPDSVRDHPFLRGRFRPASLIAGARSALSFDLGREAEFDALARRNLDRCARTGIASRAGGLVLHAEGSQTGQGDSFLFAQGLYRDADQSVHGLAGFDFRDIGVEGYRLDKQRFVPGRRRSVWGGSVSAGNKDTKIPEKSEIPSFVSDAVRTFRNKKTAGFGRMENPCYFCLRKDGGAVDRGGLENR